MSVFKIIFGALQGPEGLMTVNCLNLLRGNVQKNVQSQCLNKGIAFVKANAIVIQ